MERKRNLLAGFTLLEVVLAIGLAGAVLALLTTAIDLYLVRVDANRTRVETAQLARTLLTQMASDIRAARYWSPESGWSTGSSAESSSDTNSSTDAVTDTSSKVLGIFGTATELRIDRGAHWNWQRYAREVDAADWAATDVVPQTVQYVLNSGDTLLAGRLAALGTLADAALPGYAGLYRQQAATAASVYQTDGAGAGMTTTEQSAPELLAPEVLELELAYFDGQQMLEMWDSEEQKSLPRGVEIRLTLLEEPFELAMIQSPQERDAQLRSRENAVEYRLYVRLPNVRPRRAEGSRRSSRNDNSRQENSSDTGESRGGSSNDSSSG